VPRRLAKVFGEALSEDIRVLAASLVVGVVAGIITAIFTDAFTWSERFRYSFIQRNPLLFAFVAYSLTLVTAYSLKRLLGNLHGSSTSYVVKSYHTKMGHIGKKEAVIYTLGAISSVLAGAVVGPEGPGITIGAFVGYYVAKAFGCKGDELRKMTLVGGAAGIASVFRAPMTAMAFAIEVPYKRSLESGVFLPALIATMVSYLVTITIAGPQRLLLEVRPFKPPAPTPDLLVGAIGLGILASILTYIMYFIKHVGRLWRSP
jgi:CIC family chloride channel protein